MSRLVLVLGDQLSLGLSALRSADKSTDTVLMCEVADEASYAGHHKKKLAFIFAAMRAFASELRADGWTLDYVTLDAPGNTGSLGGELARAVQRRAPRAVVCTEAGEHRVRAMQRDWVETLGCDVTVREDDRFICSQAEFTDWASPRKQLRMEYFYRDMRRKTGLLMDGDEPEGGRWNFDTENRKPAKSELFMPTPLRFAPSAGTREVLDLVERCFPDNFGDLEPFWFPVTRAEAERAADHFLTEALARFGDFQDAMLRGEKFLYHSLLSPLINVGLLDPLDLCKRAEREWRAGLAPLNAVEGFIRQIIGWREYVRGIYFFEGPDYVRRNALGAVRPLPALYWTGETNMACMAAAIGQTREDAYAHHIQRLMITGNFALLAGIDPHAVHAWYLGVYLDAFEWVEAPNTLGMSQFADGGVVASKPYAASGAYINRMSDYCGTCHYRVKDKLGPRACPFNALYWDFIARHSDRFEKNPRMAQIVHSWNKMPDDQQQALRLQAAGFLDSLD
ncbi:cryptochrome/photolyase family protein [Hyphomonas sp.]|uniref:cryptochrome/photolyase family protein n=1 Tax=Hyphomonas sp. TaxID=87 RepID=UPI00391DFB46